MLVLSLYSLLCPLYPVERREAWGAADEAGPRKTGKWKLAAASSPPTLTIWELEPVIPYTCTCIWMTVVPLMNRNVCLTHLKRHQPLSASKSRCLVLAFLLSETPDGSGLNPTLIDQWYLANFSVDHAGLRKMFKVIIGGFNSFVKVSLFPFLKENTDMLRAVKREWKSSNPSCRTEEMLCTSPL